MAIVTAYYNLIPGVDAADYYKHPHKLQDEGLAKIPKEKIIRFPVGDGYALYYIVQLEPKKPVILWHIPYGDAWQIPHWQMKALNYKTVMELMEREKAINKLFGGNSE